MIRPRATTSGRSRLRRSRSSPKSNSRRALRPATRKKNAISPEFIEPCQLSARPGPGPNGQHRVPRTRIPARIDVGPGQRRDRRSQQDGGAAGLGPQPAKRRFQAPRPRGAQRKRRGRRRGLGHPRIISRAASPDDLVRRHTVFPARTPSRRPGQLADAEARPCWPPRVVSRGWEGRCPPGSHGPGQGL